MSKSGKPSKRRSGASAAAVNKLSAKQIAAIVVKLRRASAGGIGGAPHVGKRPQKPAAHSK